MNKSIKNRNDIQTGLKESIRDIENRFECGLTQMSLLCEITQSVYNVR